MPLDDEFAPHPLFRDPVFDGAADPVLIWNPLESTWWMIYTARRANQVLPDDVGWVHGTALGIASSDDGGSSWLYRGTVRGLGIEPGVHTYWAPEVVEVDGVFHMYVSVVRGVPSTWRGHRRSIRHYTSRSLWDWHYESTLELSSDFVIDACVHPLPGGGWRLWYKDEAHGAQTWSADSPDLRRWTVGEQSFTGAPHEGPNVFALGGWYWMIVDEWRGQRVLRSKDLKAWEARGLILAEDGAHPEDRGHGQHADVVVRGDDAVIVYFTHPDAHAEVSPGIPDARRRTTIHAARLHVDGDELRCDRDAKLPTPFLPVPSALDASRH